MANTSFHITISTSLFSLSRAKNGSVSGLRSAVSYRFGFNGQEMDNEITGLTGTHTTAMFWEYDSRLGRRWNVDPVLKQWESPYLCFSGNPIWFSDPAGDNAVKPSTEVTENEDGSYTVVGAKNDGDNNIYVVDADGNRIQTGTDDKGNAIYKTIGKTLTPFDFMNTNDKTGEMYFKTNGLSKKENEYRTFNLDNIKLKGLSYDEIGIERFISGTTGELLTLDMVEWFLEKSGKLPSMVSLASQARNGGPLDIKAHLGAMRPILYKVGDNEVIYITTIRAIGNIAFGQCMKACCEAWDYWGQDKKANYKSYMQVVGKYNQIQNNGNGYNAGWPFYGEHTLSGTFIYFGFFGVMP